MKISLSKLNEKIFFKKYQTENNTRKLCFLAGWSNILTCCIFYMWLSFKSQTTYFFSFVNVLVIITHLYISSVMINWSIKYEESKLPMWAWLSLVFLGPSGVGLIFTAYKNQQLTIKNKNNENNSVLHSLANSLIHVSRNLDSAIKWLDQKYPQEIQEFLKAVKLPRELMDEWPNKAKFLIIALYEALKQTKKKNTFEDVVFHAHWYDSRRFDFAILDPKSKLMPVKHKYSMAFIVLDEVNNYQKILNFKKEIKANIKFGPAKMICLHWGKGFKFYVNG